MRARVHLAWSEPDIAVGELTTLQGKSYFQYAGPYEIRGEPGKQQVVHTVTHSLNANFVGTQQVRNMEFAADGTLTLSASDTVPGTAVARHHRLIWSRELPA